MHEGLAVHTHTWQVITVMEVEFFGLDSYGDPVFIGDPDSQASGVGCATCDEVWTPASTPS